MPVVLIIILIFAILLVIFTLQNSTEITLDIFFWQIADAPLVLVLLACVFTGFLLALFYYYPKLWKVRREYNQLLKFNKEFRELKEMGKEKDKKSQRMSEEVTDPEGLELDEDDDKNSFFKD